MLSLPLRSEYRAHGSAGAVLQTGGRHGQEFGKAALLAAGAIALTASPAAAEDDVELVKCDQSIGSIALVDSPSAGWSQWDLGSPRMLITRLAAESGCFTPLAGNSGEPAQFLVTAVAGSQEEVDQSVNVAKGVATEALVRSGAASSSLAASRSAGRRSACSAGWAARRRPSPRA